MTRDDTVTVATLQGLRFLQNIEEEDLERIAAVAKRIDVPANQIVFREGKPIDSIYLVITGSVALEICAPGTGCRRIHTVGSGELLGWSPLLGVEHATATARTLAPSSLVQLSATQMITVCEHNPRLGYEFMKRIGQALAQRISATRLQLLDVYGSQMPAVPEERKGGGTG